MSDRIDISGDTMGLIKATAKLAQTLNKNFEDLAADCENANGQGGCLINTADGCLMLGCPLVEEDI